MGSTRPHPRLKPRALCLSRFAAGDCNWRGPSPPPHAGDRWPSNGFGSDCRLYAETNVPADIVCRLRPMYCKVFDLEVENLRPQDRPPEIAELDLVDFVQDIEIEFGVKISDNDAEHIDGSFDAIARYLAEHSRQADVKR